MLHKQIISPNAAWVLVFNDAAAVYLVSPLATEQSCHRPLEWMSRSCYLHPGNTGTGSFQRSKNKFSDSIQVKNNYIFKNSDNESVSESVRLQPLTRVFPTELGKIPQMKMYEVQHHWPVVRFYITLSRFRPIQVLAGTAWVGILW